MAGKSRNVKGFGETASPTDHPAPSVMNEQRQGRAPQHMARDTAEDQLIETRPAVTAHDDIVYTEFLRFTAKDKGIVCPAVIGYMDLAFATMIAEITRRKFRRERAGCRSLP